MHVYTVKKHLVEKITGIHIQNEFICKYKNIHFLSSSGSLPVRAQSTSGPSPVHVLRHMHVYTVKKHLVEKIIGIHLQNEFICKCKDVHFWHSFGPLPVHAHSLPVRSSPAHWNSLF